ncbi:hypothetical protein OPQ81_007945 [Rhizoctonia solani]|nr:hypothetical protein OPQ81_007945 [Rhizoctonia solani]
MEVQLPQDVAAASLAMVEAGVMIAITVYSWKLRKETQVYQMVKMTSSASVGVVERTALINQMEVRA